MIFILLSFFYRQGKIELLMRLCSLRSVDQSVGTLQRVGEIFCKVDFKSFAKWLVTVPLILTLKIFSTPFWEKDKRVV
jgi:hypothetical protein